MLKKGCLVHARTVILIQVNFQADWGEWSQSVSPAACGCSAKWWPEAALRISSRWIYGLTQGRIGLAKKSVLVLYHLIGKTQTNIFWPSQYMMAKVDMKLCGRHWTALIIQMEVPCPLGHRRSCELEWVAVSLSLRLVIWEKVSWPKLSEDRQPHFWVSVA